MVSANTAQDKYSLQNYLAIKATTFFVWILEAMDKVRANICS